MRLSSNPGGRDPLTDAAILDSARSRLPSPPETPCTGLGVVSRREKGAGCWSFHTAADAMPTAAGKATLQCESISGVRVIAWCPVHVASGRKVAEGDGHQADDPAKDDRRPSAHGVGDPAQDRAADKRRTTQDYGLQ
jgi:hypothetical protein